MNRVEDDLRKQVAKLLEEKTVDLFVGYEAASLPFRTAPCCVRTKEEAERLVWNRSCASNLASFLPQLFKKPEGREGDWTPPKVGVLAKGCDSRSIVGLIRAKQIPREGLFIVGVPCEGMIDRRKVARELGGGRITTAQVEGDVVVATGPDGSEERISLAEILADSCLSCTHRSAVLSDLFLGEAPDTSKVTPRYAEVEAFEAKSPEERWTHFVAEISRCIRCYACREACPNCYCEECFAEETAPRWIGVTTDLADLIVFHLARAFHQAGRCVDCGACVAACPQGIDLRLLNQKINKDVEELFGTEASLSLEEAEALSCYRMEDDQSFMTEP